MTISPVETIKPAINALEVTETYGRFAVEPLDRGFGTTLGNPLRRVLLGSLKGAAVTWVKIEGVLHEYSTVPHMREGVMDFLQNVKSLRLHAHADRPGKMRLEVSGAGEVAAADIIAPADFEIVNPELHLAYLDSAEARLSVEFNVETGKGYVQAVVEEGVPIGVLPVDAVFSPVRKVNYAVESTRVGQVTNYERLVLEVWTDGTVTPVAALQEATQILVNHFFIISNVDKDQEAGPARAIPPEVYNLPLERLELSGRTFNALRRHGLSKVGEVLEMNRADLLKIRNFGEKSLEELETNLQAKQFSPKDELAALGPASEGAPEEPPDTSEDEEDDEDEREEE